MILLVIVHRYEHKGETVVKWNKKEHGNWSIEKPLPERMPLAPGDSFNITGHLHNDSLTLLLNEAHLYRIPLSRDENGIDVSESTVFKVFESNVALSYVDLISGC